MQKDRINGEKEGNKEELDRLNQAVSDKEEGLIDNDTYQTILAETKYAAVRQGVYDEFESELLRLQKLEKETGEKNIYCISVWFPKIDRAA